MRKVINVLLSGGSGTRLWPLSRISRPKQFLKMFEDKSLFQHTVLRNRGLVDHFMLITNAYQERLAQEQLDELDLSLEHKVIEPVGRNTAAAITFAALKMDADDLLFITPSDHMIEDLEAYHKAFKRAKVLAEAGNLVTFGIRPTYPESGFGYIESKGEDVIRFTEKPDRQKAEEFLSKGNYYWNSGMFCFKASVFLAALAAHRSDILIACQQALASSVQGVITLDAMEAIPSESVDYAVFEKSDQVKTVPSHFKWTDLGSFSSMVNYFEQYPVGIGGLQPLNGIDNSNAYAFSSKKVYGVGINALTIVETDDCILILPHAQGDRIKELYSHVKEERPSLVE